MNAGIGQMFEKGLSLMSLFFDICQWACLMLKIDSDMERYVLPVGMVDRGSFEKLDLQ